MLFFPSTSIPHVFSPATTYWHYYCLLFPDNCWGFYFPQINPRIILDWSIHFFYACKHYVLDVFSCKCVPFQVFRFSFSFNVVWGSASTTSVKYSKLHCNVQSSFKQVPLVILLTILIWDDFWFPLSSPGNIETDSHYHL